MIVTDGVGPHITPDFLFWLTDQNIVLALRAPRGSSKQQPEGLVMCFDLKNDKNYGCYQLKQKRLQQLRCAKGATCLSVVEGLKLLKVSWEGALTEGTINWSLREAGRKEEVGGLLVVTRKPCQKLKAQEAQAAVKKAARGKTIAEIHEASKFNWGDLHSNIEREVSSKGADPGDRMPGAGQLKLNGSGLAMIPGGANSPEALRCVELKKKAAAVKSMARPQLLQRLSAEFHGDPSVALKPPAGSTVKAVSASMQARLLIMAAVEPLLNTIPVRWVASKSDKAIRSSIALQLASIAEGEEISPGHTLTDEQTDFFKAAAAWWSSHVASEAAGEAKVKAEAKASGADIVRLSYAGKAPAQAPVKSEQPGVPLNQPPPPPAGFNTSYEAMAIAIPAEPAAAPVAASSPLEQSPKRVKLTT